MDSPFYTYDQAAAYLQMSRRHLERLVQDQAIGFAKLGRSVRFTRQQLDDYVARESCAPLPY
jgi:excisionase family DNA binding protein